MTTGVATSQFVTISNEDFAVLEAMRLQTTAVGHNDRRTVVQITLEDGAPAVFLPVAFTAIFDRLKWIGSVAPKSAFEQNPESWMMRRSASHNLILHGSYNGKPMRAQLRGLPQKFSGFFEI